MAFVALLVSRRLGARDLPSFLEALEGRCVRTGVDADRVLEGELLLRVEVARGVERPVRLDVDLLREAERDDRCTLRGATTARADERDAPLLRREDADRTTGLLRDADRVRDDARLARLRDELLADADRLDDRAVRDAERRDDEDLLADLCDCCRGLPAATSGAVPSKIRNADIMARA